MRSMKLISMALLLGACSVDLTGDTASSSSPIQTGARRTRLAAAPGVDLTRPHAVAAADSLETVRALVGSGDPEARGFHSRDEVDAATLTQPLPMFMVGLDQLRSYEGADAHALLIDEEQVMYVLSVDGEARTALVVRKRANGTYSPSSFGHINVAKMAHSGRGVLKARGVAEADLRLVEIPTMGVKFLAHDVGGRMLWTALLDVPGTRFRAGETHPAEDVLATLQPLAASSVSN